MIILLNGLLIALLVLIFLPVSVLFVQVLLACLSARSLPSAQGLRPRVAVLVPAHNESSIILSTLNSIRPQLLEGDRLLVVADNCSDDTAALARTAGAEVVERSNDQQRGKGYALDFGVHHLAGIAPDVVIIVDADCQVGEGSIERLAMCCIDSKRPTQALYLMHAPAGAGLKVRLAEFAWCVKNLVRPQGWARLGLPCQLMGTGMAFLWRDLALIDLASGHIVEDLKMGFDFCRSGKPPLFCPDARVTSYFPRSDEGLSTQRTRWEHGHLGVILGDAPKLFVESIGRGNWSLLAMTLDLLVPPLALLTLVLGAVFGLSWLLLVLGGASSPALIASAGVAILSVTIVLAWSQFGRGVISFSALLYAPFYAVKKIPLYLGFLLNRQVEWVRSQRDEKKMCAVAWQNSWQTIIRKLRVVSDLGDEQGLIDVVSRPETTTVLGFVNAHAMNLVVRNNDYYNALSAVDVLLRDGSGMAILFRRLGLMPGLNMDGTDFIPKLLAAFRGRRVAFWGTKEPFLGNAVQRSEALFAVNVVSAHHGFAEVDAYINLARQLRPELVVLGMGMPKQEVVAARLAASGVPCLIVCGGAILDFLGGKVTRAPKWVRRLGCEWVFRLMSEPKRLFCRYVVGNPLFLLRTLICREATT